MVHRMVVLSALLPTAAAYEYTNDKITSCARQRRAAGVPWLTANNASYVCTDAQWDSFYDPSVSIAYFAIDDGVTSPVAASCPDPSHSIQCVIFASWGQVAGGPDACTDECSTGMKGGDESCCAKACTAGSSFRSSDDAKCSGNQWLSTPSSACKSESEAGYCDCCPDCLDCVHGSPPELARELGSYVDNRFCDCRNGLEVAFDYSPCWNSCLDCLGDDGTVDYLPEDVAATCIGKAECFVRVKQGTNSNDWYSCTSLAEGSCVKSNSGSGSSDSKAKAKGAFLCGPSSVVI